jgi:hypothetical protein
MATSKVLRMSGDVTTWTTESAQQFEHVYSLVIDGLIAECAHLENVMQGLYKITNS